MNLRRAFIIFAAAIGALGILAIAGILKPIGSGLQAIFLPVVRPIAGIGRFFERSTDPAQSLEAARQRIAELEARVSSVSVDYVKLKSLELENQNLKDAGNFLKNSPYEHVGAHIIARSVDPIHASLLIDRGSADGLEIGMAAVVGEGTYVGKVISLSSHVSRIMLVSDESSRVSAAVAGTKQLIGVVQGLGNHVAELTLVPHIAALKQDDVIVTAGTEEKIPPDLVIGMATDVQAKETDPFKSATIEPQAERERIDLVVLLRPAASAAGN